MASLSNATIRNPHDPSRWSRGRRCPRTVHSSALEIDAEVSARVGGGVHLHAGRRADPGHRSRSHPGAGPVPGLRGAVGRGGEALDVIGCHAQVVSLDPGRLDEVIECIGTVGAVTGTSTTAEALMKSLRARVDAVRERVRGRNGPGSWSWSGPTRPSTPVTGSPTRWRPQGASRSSLWPAPGRAGSPGRRSGRRRRHHDLHAVWVRSRGCGGTGAGLLARPEAAVFGHVIAVDANAYFCLLGPGGRRGGAPGGTAARHAGFRVSLRAGLARDGLRRRGARAAFSVAGTTSDAGKSRSRQVCADGWLAEGMQWRPSKPRTCRTTPWCVQTALRLDGRSGSRRWPRKSQPKRARKSYALKPGSDLRSHPTPMGKPFANRRPPDG